MFDKTAANQYNFAKSICTISIVYLYVYKKNVTSSSTKICLDEGFGRRGKRKGVPYFYITSALKCFKKNEITFLSKKIKMKPSHLFPSKIPIHNLKVIDSADKSIVLFKCK